MQHAFSQFLVETNALLIVHNLKALKDVSYFDTLILDIKDMFNQLLLVNIYFIKQYANIIVHQFARNHFLCVID